MQLRGTHFFETHFIKEERSIFKRTKYRNKTARILKMRSKKEVMEKKNYKRKL